MPESSRAAAAANDSISPKANAVMSSASSSAAVVLAITWSYGCRREAPACPPGTCSGALRSRRCWQSCQRAPLRCNAGRGIGEGLECDSPIPPRFRIHLTAGVTRRQSPACKSCWSLPRRDRTKSLHRPERFQSHGVRTLPATRHTTLLGPEGLEGRPAVVCSPQVADSCPHASDHRGLSGCPTHPCTSCCLPHPELADNTHCSYAQSTFRPRSYGGRGGGGDGQRT